MRVRDWQDVLEDVVESNVDADGWRAVAGDRDSGVGEDLFVGHPQAGVYQLKTYAKNPFEVRGVGGRVARRIDDDLDPLFPEETRGRFGVQQPMADKAEMARRAEKLEGVIETHAAAPTTGSDLFDDVMTALDSPAFGPIDYDRAGRPGPLDRLSSTFDEAEEVLDAELEDLIERDGVGRGFM